MLVQWQNYGRNILIQARMSQSPQIIHEALDETRRMGLVSLLEWKVCTSHPLCCVTLTLYVGDAALSSILRHGSSSAG